MILHKDLRAIFAPTLLTIRNHHNLTSPDRVQHTVEEGNMDNLVSLLTGREDFRQLRPGRLVRVVWVECDTHLSQLRVDNIIKLGS